MGSNAGAHGERGHDGAGMSRVAGLGGEQAFLEFLGHAVEAGDEVGVGESPRIARAIKMALRSAGSGRSSGCQRRR